MLVKMAAAVGQETARIRQETRSVHTDVDYLCQDSSAEDMSLTDQLAYYEMEADAIKKVGILTDRR